MNDTTDQHGALPDVLPENPLPLAEAWFLHAQEAAMQRNPNAMTLATVDAGGRPAARIVLCKSFVADPGYLVFYTNYGSSKSRDMADDPRVAIVMHWDALGRQLRLEGHAVKSPEAESDAYFATRGWGSQLGAWGSDQSRPIDDRAALIRQVRSRAGELGINLGDDTSTLADGSTPTIRRPPHWGGYRIWPAAVELWAEGADRIHDRARWHRELTTSADATFECGPWTATRLQP